MFTTAAYHLLPFNENTKSNVDGSKWQTKHAFKFGANTSKSTHA